MGRKFWIFIALLAVLMLALEYQMPRHFTWKATFAHADRQPFGCYVFDSMMATTMPHGYTVCRKTVPSSSSALVTTGEKTSMWTRC